MADRCLLGVFAHQDSTVAAIKALQQGGITKLQGFSPVPDHEISALLDHGKSPVRYFTLAGGLLGLAIGWGITLGPLNNYSLHVGGKPLVSLPPFGVVAYICTILFGALATVAGMIFLTRLPHVRLTPGYDKRISSDHYGVRVCCSEGERGMAETILKNAGAVEIRENEP